MVIFINELRSKFGSPEDAAFICCDGEAVQILPLLNETMLHLLNSLLIIIGKLAGSTTAVTQPNDAYKIFSLTKYNLKTITKTQISNQTFLYNQLLIAINQHKFISKDVLKGISTEKVINGIIRCVISIIKSSTYDVIIKSFKTVGINQKREIDMEQMLNQFQITPSNNELANLCDNISFGIKKFEKR